MKAKAAPASALNLAVEAFALANARHLLSSNGKITQMALSRYGASLAAVRRTIMHGKLPSDDMMLMAILTIDMFEIVFMVREEPLKLHSNAIEYLLAARGAGQVLSPIGHALYRMTNRRLQVRQLGLELSPLSVQLACIDLLDLSNPSQSLGAIHLRAQQTLATSRSQLSCGSTAWEDLEHLVWRIEGHLDESQHWQDSLNPSWVPKRIRLSDHPDIFDIFTSSPMPITSQVWIYQDPVISHDMNFFYQGQLALRSMLMDILATMRSLAPDQLERAKLDQQIETHKTTISLIADILVESITPLLGSVELNDEGEPCLTGRKITWCFARGVCWALQQAKRVSVEHKAFTYRVEDWMRRMNGIL
ncbi:hypothetical protein FBEOM_13788 [Fusarium beomiforme]|uniref:Transcription factor n=1 Tax=Fusarium beomiforme TaxID=44412 RepID=A0A9P5DR72_9HYPO|nr:hypothetical protein FBEOM_13788 [Fusarium beomiforme]